jgi:hypothetical protein
MEVCSQLHALTALPQGKETVVPTEWETGWAVNLVWLEILAMTPPTHDFHCFA